MPLTIPLKTKKVTRKRYLNQNVIHVRDFDLHPSCITMLTNNK